MRAIAKSLGVAHTTLSRWLDGSLVPSEDQTSAFADALGLADRAREDLLQVTRWVSAHRGAVGLFGVSDQVTEVLEVESEATVVAEWSPLRVPDLLQTARYARRTEPRNPAQDVALKLGRQSLMFQNRAKQYKVFLGTSALASRVGGDDVMTEQIERLLSAANQENVELRVVPDRLDWHDGQHGAFVLYDREGGHGVVYLKHLDTATYLTYPEVVARYRTLLAELGSLALTPEQSHDHLENALRTLMCTES
ncbi:DUF5753 domain-containing protein [Amycolatopsis thermoflava]|uniref:DUF5753 domain-containing protein n=1 Tax=Amycolatopsis thermoflava TaxID=84480 RepID=UPI003D75D0CE